MSNTDTTDELSRSEKIAAYRKAKLIELNPADHTSEEVAMSKALLSLMSDPGSTIAEDIVSWMADHNLPRAAIVDLTPVVGRIKRIEAEHELMSMNSHVPEFIGSWAELVKEAEKSDLITEDQEGYLWNIGTYTNDDRQGTLILSGLPELPTESELGWFALILNSSADRYFARTLSDVWDHDISHSPDRASLRIVARSTV